jgi:hypothetical protein
MIAQAFLDFISGLMAWILQPFSGVDFAPWVTQLDINVGTVLSYLSGLGVWIDWAFVSAVLGGVALIWTICFSVKLVLRIVSHIPEVGGAG